MSEILVEIKRLENKMTKDWITNHKTNEEDWQKYTSLIKFYYNFK